ncbi:MAG: hypothetical protein U5Q44_12790 [Dehalococcoidia bacterium]|nr:hypothetical protein [Dehalococcoidia bacterium]
MIIALYGADELGIQRHIGRLKDEVGTAPEELQSNLTVLTGRDVQPGDILGAVMVPPFLAAHRMVIVEGFVDRFYGGRRAASLGPFQEMLDTIAGGMPSQNILVLTGGALQRGDNTLLDWLKKASAEVVEYPELKGQALQRYIREEAGSRGIRMRTGPGQRIAPDAATVRGAATDPVALLADIHGSNTLALANELDKLALYTMGREATVDDVALVCSGERAFSTFQLVDALADGDFARARDAYTILNKDTSSQELIATIATSYRRLINVHAALESGGEDAVMKMGAGMQYQGLRSAAIGRAKRHGLAGLQRAYQAIVETDRGIKKGEVRQEFAMDLLLARLATIAPRNNRGSRGR